MKSIILNTGGVCVGNPGPGGWAYLAERNGRRVRRNGGVMGTTGNRMEMRAVIEGLRALEPHAPLKVRLRSDSFYVLNGMQKWMRGWQAAGWRRRGGRLQNADLWRELYGLASDLDLSYEYVAGYRRDPMIRACDRMAARAACAHPTT